ncbi:MAG: hypothetical protein NTW52_06215 [Planctomycetota bacterium]|nr:hypothetical protein [Planctomycetota bacterium]
MSIIEYKIDGHLKQSVTSVLDAHASTRPWIGGVEELMSKN